MQLKNYYWYFKSALPKKICNEIVKLGVSTKNSQASVGGSPDPRLMGKEKLKDLKTQRDSNITWLAEKWIYKNIHPYINLANKNAEWNFQWDFSEACQYTKYKKGQYYDWHYDSWDQPYSNINNKNFFQKIRKLSVTISLSDPREYKGGVLEFQLPGKKPIIRKCKEILPKGSIVVFPSHIWHRVSPVTKGERKSLVVWNLGWPFK